MKDKGIGAVDLYLCHESSLGGDSCLKSSVSFFPFKLQTINSRPPRSFYCESCLITNQWSLSLSAYASVCSRSFNSGAVMKAGFFHSILCRCIAVSHMASIKSTKFSANLFAESIAWLSAFKLLLCHDPLRVRLPPLVQFDMHLAGCPDSS